MEKRKDKGLQWYKCDLHLHTSTSNCFKDNDKTASGWGQRALEAGLDCVAVTDHNDSSNIHEIMNEAKKTDLIVFPGVEITCDSAGIHMIVLFDIDGLGCTLPTDYTLRHFLTTSKKN